MEELIHDEVNHFNNFIEKNIDKPFDFAGQLNLPILNALWKVLVGERYDYEDEKLLNICNRLTESFKMVMQSNRALFTRYPILDKIFSRWSSSQYIIKTFNSVIDLIQDNIDNHKATLDVNEPRDYIDMVLREIEKTADTKSSFYGTTGEENLKLTLFDLFLAGSETTSTTLTWAALYMVRSVSLINIIKLINN